MKVLAFVLLCLFIAVSEAKVYEKCELAKILKISKMDVSSGYSLDNWVCLAYHESRFDSKAVGPPNWDGSRDYGIFQINSRWWCSNGEGTTANGCKTSCSAFTTDDITDDITCAKRIVRDPNGIRAWVAWVNHCEGRDLSSWTKDCSL
ncbi:lysozyme C, milk isozyme [Anolis carolinensis]|uniref:Glycosyl hydrolases family 22 (GH22) domain-containing protein n=1 Tax=Anolis carolinensis TaxID=28377 RepID=R4GBJ7_ANOCA|nr:PREDICTED: lysozyme C, milk isozyme [Anolis carolinensis]|eukprot:XP_003225844.1 PREDICTED: lysozyme C, milk isozyme [Anolis carolinensis]